MFALAYLVYFGVRALTEGSAPQALTHARELIRLEQRLGVAWERALQEAVVGMDLAVDAANAIYIYGHWPVIIVGGILLFRHRPAQYVRLRDAFLLSGAIGLVIFAVFPVAPPRLTDLPLVDTITRHDEGYRQIVPPSLVNEYAAMPSFHAGWNLLLGIVVLGATRNPLLRVLAILGPAAMIVAVVVTANHFVIDVIVGVAIAIASLLLADLLRQRRSARHIMEPREGRRPPHGARRRGRATVPRRASRRQRPRAAAAGRGARRRPD